MKKVLLIDNYDSFVYNLARYVEELGGRSDVVRNDEITLAEIESYRPSHIIISPGPCTPDEAGITLSVIQTFGHHIPILGVCLGHQAIGQAYGAVVERAKKPMHGKSCFITHHEKNIFENLPSPLEVARYHSLIVANQALPAALEITAMSEEQEIMGLQHKQFPVYGVQFHPESILTQCGHALIKNFLKLKGTRKVKEKKYAGIL